MCVIIKQKFLYLRREGLFYSTTFDLQSSFCFQVDTTLSSNVKLDFYIKLLFIYRFVEENFRVCKVDMLARLRGVNNGFISSVINRWLRPGRQMSHLLPSCCPGLG